MFKIEDYSIKNSGNPQRSKCIRFNTLNGYFYVKISIGAPKGERAVQLLRQTRSPQEAKTLPRWMRHFSDPANSGCGRQFYGALLGKGSQAPATPILRSAAVRAAANQSRVTAQRAVEDYIHRLI